MKTSKAKASLWKKIFLLFIICIILSIFTSVLMYYIVSLVGFNIINVFPIIQIAIVSALMVYLLRKNNISNKYIFYSIAIVCGLVSYATPLYMGYLDFKEIFFGIDDIIPVNFIDYLHFSSWTGIDYSRDSSHTIFSGSGFYFFQSFILLFNIIISIFMFREYSKI